MNPRIYRLVRHPMYSVFLLYGIGQALVVANWVMAVLFAFRMRAEERMMLDTFGNEYSAYMAKTKRLLPGIG